MKPRFFLQRLGSALALSAAVLSASFSHAAVVLEYHHISNTGPASTRISPENFLAQLDYLDEAGFSVVPLNELATLVRNGQSLPEKTVAITFDDAYASVYHSAFPILRKRNLPFTFFVNTDAVGTSASFVTWAQLREMKQAGATIANHTASHKHMVRTRAGESEADYATRLGDDITRAQTALERELGDAPKLFAYPFGEYNHVAKRVVKELGFIGFGQHSGVIDPKGDLLIIPRFPFGGQYSDLADFKMKVNTKPMPVAKVDFFAADETRLDDVVVKAGERPWVKLTLRDNAIASKVNCFATGQGAIETQVRDGAVWARANTAFKPGRMRYNCTALSEEKGRFYWFTQQWLVTDSKGAWTYAD